ncbi:Hydroxyacylglutathione hydrolase [Arenibacter antarcticus]|uniref:Rhodanese-like domain-containing protein n=1 Tax=Arenibacter antarcticus TaxID=2040469 RepID=A0ABW5VJG1_9FLAO|nr:rhodanese-like domain-containing protein [Arenibacter sp. H213]MCM4166111.1 MBL fold metallo-hydrolase [Arenibacter sp. H213]
MKIKQFEYGPLSHYSYAIISKGQMVIIDPQRNPEAYYEFATANNAKIIAVIETHSHADFVSSHLQIHKETGATIYNSKKLGAMYPHTNFDEGDVIPLGNINFTALNTPGHSPDSITVVAKEGDKTVLFTGDTLFVGDVGRPDLREDGVNKKQKQQELAEAMFDSIHTKFHDLPDDAIVYPAHGAGSLCGKSMGDASSSTLGDERKQNWAFITTSKKEFVKELLDSQPFIPSYFGYNVDVNKKGTETIRKAIAKVAFKMNSNVRGLIVDIREESEFKKGHLKGSINIQAASETAKFETWLGAIIKPEEKFSMVIDHPKDLETILERVAKIGYENQLQKVVTLPSIKLKETSPLDIKDFKKNPKDYTIIDVRNTSEVEEGKVFESALSMPLNTLRDSVNKIPTNKPIVVHCAGGYRSAAGSSIIEKNLNSTKVYDLGEKVNDFK